MTQSLSMSGKLTLGLSALFGLLYLGFGLAWLTAPSVIAGALGASLLQGTGLSTQLGDSAAFFLCAGGFMLYGVLKRHSSYLVAGGLLIGLVAPARLIAWQVHGAVLMMEPIVIEVITCVVLLLAARAVRQSPGI